MSEHRTSWSLVDLAPIFAGDDLEPPPSMLRRTDGAGLVYAGKVHSFAGEPESGKSWLATWACFKVMADGGRVLYLDFEDRASGIVARLRALGAPDEAIRGGFGYARPDEPLTKDGRAGLEGSLTSTPALSIVDGVTEAMTLLGLDPLSNRDVARFMEEIPRRLVRAGSAVILVDHVVKARGDRGRFALGAQHKLAGIDGAAYSFEVLRPFGRGLTGVARIEVTKDRPGFVRQAAADGKVMADLHLSSDESGSVEVSLRPAESSRQGDRMPASRRRVLGVLEGREQPLTLREVGDRLAQDGQGSPLKRSTIQDALDDLAGRELAAGDRPGNGLANAWWRI